MRTLPCLLAASLVLAPLALLPTAAAGPDPTRFAYDLRDATGDVVLVASAGFEVVSAKPVTDIVRFQSDLVDERVSVTLTFAAEPPMQDFLVRLAMGVGSLEWDASSPDGTEGLTVSRSGNGLTFVTDIPQVLDPETFTPKGADCLSASVRATYVPADDPVTETEEGAQGWMDEMATTPSWCGARTLPDGLAGECPPAAVAAASVTRALTDPAGDPRKSYPAETLDKPAADIVGVESKLVDGRVVVRVRVAEAPLDETLDVSLNFEESEVEGWDAGHSLKLNHFGGSFEATGSYAKEMFDAEPSAFRVEMQPESDGVTLSFCASLVPADAPCVALRVTLAFREPERGTDTLVESPDPCAGKKAAVGSDGDDGADGGDGSDAGDDGSDGADEPDDGTTPPPSNGLPPAETDGKTASEGSAKTPLGGALALLALVGAATLVGRRRA